MLPHKIKTLNLFIVVVSIFLTGCQTFTLQAMSRTDGKVYTGSAQKTGNGQGTVKIAIAGVDYSGTYARTSSEQYTSFVNSYAHDNRGNSATASGIGSFFGSNITLMAILTSSSGKGLRCALQGDRSSGTGGGICVDAKNNVYDITYNISGGLF